MWSNASLHAFLESKLHDDPEKKGDKYLFFITSRYIVRVCTHTSLTTLHVPLLCVYFCSEKEARKDSQNGNK